MQRQAQQRRELEQNLRLALQHGEFELFYQPVLEIATRKVRHFEALIRWRRPARRADRARRVHPRRRAERPHPADRRLGVARGLQATRPGGRARSASRSTFPRCKWPPAASKPMSPPRSPTAASPPYRLELEITETTLLNASEKHLATLRGLKAMGVRIAMDDFGAGHSSLNYLQSFPFDKIKIDRAFARGHRPLAERRGDRQGDHRPVPGARDADDDGGRRDRGAVPRRRADGRHRRRRAICSARRARPTRSCG